MKKDNTMICGVLLNHCLTVNRIISKSVCLDTRLRDTSLKRCGCQKSVAQTQLSCVSIIGVDASLTTTMHASSSVTFVNLFCILITWRSEMFVKSEEAKWQSNDFSTWFSQRKFPFEIIFKEISFLTFGLYPFTFFFGFRDSLGEPFPDISEMPEDRDLGDEGTGVAGTIWTGLSRSHFAMTLRRESCRFSNIILTSSILVTASWTMTYS